jgi:4'-phosphopantetheinyl transferase
MLKFLAAVNNEKWSSEVFQFKLAQLPAAMITSNLQYKNWQHQQAKILSKLLIKKQMSLFKTNFNLDDIKRNEFNCPYINDSFFFSTAHTHELVVCLASDIAPVGIDIECTDSKTKYFPLDLFSKEECVYLESSLNYSNEFYRLFTRKEALMKLSGKGVFMNFEENSVLENEIMFNNEIYYFNSISLLNNYMLSYITNDKMHQLEIEWIDSFT